MNLPHYSRALRCIGQELQIRDIDIFELKTYAGGYRLTAADPHPPYRELVELTFSPQTIEILDREGRGRRGRGGTELRFDTVSETLRAIGEYMDRKQVRLIRIDSSASSSAGDGTNVVLEYATRAGDVQTEDLPMSFVRDASVRMYKRRSQIANPIDMLTRKR